MGEAKQKGDYKTRKRRADLENRRKDLLIWGAVWDAPVRRPAGKKGIGIVVVIGSDFTLGSPTQDIREREKGR